MKILIDYITPLSPEVSFYRKNLINEINRSGSAKLLVLSVKKEIPFRKVKLVNLNEEGNFLNFTKTSKLSKVLQKYKPDLFITFSPVKSSIKKQVTTYLFAEEIIAGLPSEPTKRQAKMLMGYTKLLVRSRYSQLLIANNYFIDKEKIFVAPTGIDEKFLRQTIPSDIRDVRRVLTIYRVSAPYMITFGRLEERTNIESLFEAFSKLHFKYPDLKLVIASPDYKIGWDNKPIPLNKKAEALLELTDFYKINRKVIFTGTVDRDHLPLLLANAEASVNLSINKPFSLSLLEALAAEVSLIISDWPVHKEIAQNAAKVASPQVIGSIYDAVNSVLSDHETRVSLKQRASKRVPDFLWPNLINALFEQILFDLSHKPRRQLGLIYEEGQEEYFSGVFEKFFEVIKIEKPLRENKSHAIMNLDPANYLTNLSLILKTIIDKQTVLVVNIPDWYFERFRTRLSDKALVRFRMLLDRILFNLAYDYAFTTNPLYLKHLQKQLGFKEKKTVFMPLVMEEDVKLKQGNVKTITVRANTKKDLEIVDMLRMKLKEKFRTVKIVTVADADDKRDSLATSAIYIELDNNTSQYNILKAFEYKNVCICPKSRAVEYLVKEGINGYHFEESPMEVIKEITTLLENKTHLNDIRKINYARFEEHKLENVQKQIADFVEKL